MPMKRNLQPKPPVPSSAIESGDVCNMLGGFTNCTIGSLTVDIHVTPTFTTTMMSVEEEFDKIVSDYIVYIHCFTCTL